MPLLKNTVISWHANTSILCVLLVSSHRILKRRVTQGLRFNKMSTFCCTIKDTLRWNWLSPLEQKFGLVCHCLDGGSDAGVSQCAGSTGHRQQWLKIRWCPSVTMKWFDLVGSLKMLPGPSGVLWPHFETVVRLCYNPQILRGAKWQRQGRRSFIGFRTMTSSPLRVPISTHKPSPRGKVFLTTYFPAGK